MASLGSSYMFLPGRKLLGRVAYSSQEPGSYLSLDDGEDLGSEEMLKLETGVSSSFLDESFSLLRPRSSIILKTIVMRPATQDRLKTESRCTTPTMSTERG